MSTADDLRKEQDRAKDQNGGATAEEMRKLQKKGNK